LRNSEKINEFERKISANISDRMLIAHSVGLDQRSCATSDRQTRLVPGWVTVCGRVNHHGM